MDFSMIKQRAKNALHSRYWPLVGLVLLASVLGATSGSFGFSFSFGSDSYKEIFSEEFLNALKTFAVICAGAAVAYMLLVGNVVSVGLAKVGLSAYRGESFGILDLFHGFKNGRYGRNVGAMALSTLFVLLGLMAFIIPGIIIGLGLFPLPYLLAEDDEISGMDAIRKAWSISSGYKGNIFLFQLSFIGWIILTALTFGAVGIFYANPYMEVAFAGYYHELTGSRFIEDRSY